MQVKANKNKLDDYISNIAKSIAKKSSADTKTPWALVGIRSRGDVIARRIIAQKDFENMYSEVGTLDITLYRDDLSEIGAQPIVRTTEIPFNIDGVNLVLVDDVLMTGRSVRAALQSIMDIGRPARIWLAVLIDRGRRELPIAPDFVGIDLTNDSTIKKGNNIEVKITPTDEKDEVVIV